MALLPKGMKLSKEQLKIMTTIYIAKLQGGKVLLKSGRLVALEEVGNVSISCIYRSKINEEMKCGTCGKLTRRGEYCSSNCENNPWKGKR